MYVWAITAGITERCSTLQGELLTLLSDSVVVFFKQLQLPQYMSTNFILLIDVILTVHIFVHRRQVLK